MTDAGQFFIESIDWKQREDISMSELLKMAAKVNSIIDTIRVAAIKLQKTLVFRHYVVVHPETALKIISRINKAKDTI